MSELHKFTRLFKNVKRCRGLNWQEKAILSEIISYQLDGKPFKQKDVTIAIELAMDKGTVSKFINRLAKKGILNKTTVSFPPPNGGKYKRLRTVTVIDIDKWATDNIVPVIVANNEVQIESTINDEPTIENTISMDKIITVENIGLQNSVVSETQNELPTGFKKTLEKSSNGESDEAYQSRLNYYIKLGTIVELNKPIANDFIIFATSVVQNGVLDGRFLPTIWQRMEKGEQRKVSNELLTTVKHFMG